MCGIGERLRNPNPHARTSPTLKKKNSYRAKLSGAIRLTEPREANLRAVTKVNPIRPRDADERRPACQSKVKPATGGEATGAVHPWAFRGGWGQRAGKDSSRELGDPAEQAWKHDQRLAGIHNRESAPARESERPIVARKRVTTVEPRGLAENMLL